LKKKRENNIRLDEKETVLLAIDTLQSVISQDFKASDIEVAVVTASNRYVKKLTADEMETYLNILSQKD
jgi:20S proteasome subunit alpha 1